MTEERDFEITGYRLKLTDPNRTVSVRRRVNNADGSTFWQIETVIDGDDDTTQILTISGEALFVVMKLIERLIGEAHSGEPMPEWEQIDA